MKYRFNVFVMLMFIVSTSCFACLEKNEEAEQKIQPKNNKAEIVDYESCVKAGGIILKTFPPKCKSPKGNETFTKDMKNKLIVKEKANKEKPCICTDDMPSCPVECEE